MDINERCNDTTADRERIVLAALRELAYDVDERLRRDSAQPTETTHAR